MKNYSDPEARQLAMDNLNHQASLRPKVSAAEAVSAAKVMGRMLGPTQEEIEEWDEVGDNDVKW